MAEDIRCPFCNEDGFDFIGLKMHLENGWCVYYNNINLGKSSRSNKYAKEPKTQSDKLPSCQCETPLIYSALEETCKRCSKPLAP